ncbi:MAG: hypothetical protein AAGI11_13760 [Pseudomonadota bacterium]
MSRYFWLLSLAFSLPVNAELLGLQSGRLAAQYLYGTYPDDSLLRELIGTPSQDLNADLRLIVSGGRKAWRWQGDYQMILRTGDTLELARDLDGNALGPRTAPDDDRRLLNLTHVISDDDNRILLHRLDRLQLGYTGDKTVLKLGRQAVSWGNGLFYNPVDFFNPFDPAAIDTEFKTGDDMLYGQYLFDNGSDVQAVQVWRRDSSGDPSADVNTTAVKYHAFVGAQELDLLAARHYEDDNFSAGGIASVGGAILRGDVMLTDTDLDSYLSAVVNYTISWVAWGKNMSGLAEYFFNDMGLHEDDYSELEQQTDLLVRLARGELFTLGRHYFAGGITVEMTPLINLTPNAFINLGDGSGLAQFVLDYSVEQNLQLLAALNVPFGSNGTEFGGLDSPVAGLQLSTGPSLFAQLNFYF